MDPVLIGFVVYLTVVLVVGVIAFRKTQSQAGFILGDRKLGPWVIAFSERASGESAWLLVGLPGAALALGFIELWTAIGCTTGILLSWTFVAPRLREFVGHSDSLTLPDFFRQRYPETHEAIRIVASLIITFFFTFYVASQFNAAGKVLDTTFGELLGTIQGSLGSIGLDLETTTIGMLIGTIIVLFYTVMGGFVAVAWTDVAQGIIMVFTCVVLPITAWFKLGGNDVLPAETRGALQRALAHRGHGWAGGDARDHRRPELGPRLHGPAAPADALHGDPFHEGHPHQPHDRDLVGRARVLGRVSHRHRRARRIRRRPLRRPRAPDALPGADGHAGLAGRHHDQRRDRRDDVDRRLPIPRHHLDALRGHLAQVAQDATPRRNRLRSFRASRRCA